jgi:putative ABC transport system ATP-binding protein/lipoprotein-releasing system ATP-binding protein
MTALASCRNLSRTFGKGHNAVTALIDATCTIEEGAQIVITGASGSGKSTLLHLIAGLDQPTGGTIEWPGIGDLAALRPGPVGVIFQGPSLIASLTVLENVSMPPLLTGMSTTAASVAAMDSLERLGLDSVATKLPEEISGGQAQRVAVARALAGSPRLILADEPTGQLDRANATNVIDALREAADASGAALVVTTHDPLVASAFADEWAMRDGELKVMEVSR